MKKHVGWLLGLCVLGVGLAVGGVQVGSSKAAGTNRVGLVVAYGDGTVKNQCVSFSADKITGLEVLQAAGLPLEVSYSPAGAAVCKISQVGCSADNCFCDSPPNFWAYWHLKNGNWVFSQLGAANYSVSNGDVEGWIWGPGQSNPPPQTSFDQICAEQPTATATEMPTLTPTATPAPTSTHPPTQAPTATPAPTSTQPPTLAPTDTPVATSTDMPTLAPTDTPAATSTSLPALTPTGTPAATSTGTPNLTPAAMAVSRPTLAPTITASQTPGAPLTGLPAVGPTQGPVQPTEVATPISVASSGQTPLAAGPQPGASEAAPASNTHWAGYLLVGVIVINLGFVLCLGLYVVTHKWK